MSGLPRDGGLLLPLRERPFRLLASGRLLMYFANAMAPIVLAFAVLDLTGSKTDLGIVVGARSVANVVLLLAAGVIADRFPRTVILRGSACAAAAVQGAIAASMLLDFTTIPLLILLSVLNGALSAVSMPASAALTPQTVPARLLRPANALMRMATNLGMIIGAALGGVLVAAVGPGWGLACNAVAFLGATLCYFGLRVPAGNAERSHPLRELREGWQEFTSRTWVWVVVAQFMVVNAVVAGGVHVLGPAVADETFGRTGWGIVLAAQMAGAVAGGFVAARSRARHALRIGVAAAALEALPLAVLAETPGVLFLTAAMFVNGVAMEQFGVAWEVSLQENVPEDRLARVYSYDALGSFIALPVGEMAAGPVADRAGVGTTLLVGAALVVAATAAALCSRDVRELATRVHKEPETAGT